MPSIKVKNSPPSSHNQFKILFLCLIEAQEQVKSYLGAHDRRNAINAESECRFLELSHHPSLAEKPKPRRISWPNPGAQNAI